MKTYFLGNNWLVVAALFFGGILIIWLEKRGYGESTVQKIEDISPKTSVIIGITQALAIIPGVSRSLATIVAGRLKGVGKETIVEFSFLLAIPTMLAATGYDLAKNAGSFAGGEFGLLAIGFITAFASALLAVKFFINYIKKHSFTAFGVYRIILAVLFASYLLWYTS